MQPVKWLIAAPPDFEAELRQALTKRLSKARQENRSELPFMGAAALYFHPVARPFSAQVRVQFNFPEAFHNLGRPLLRDRLWHWAGLTHFQEMPEAIDRITFVGHRPIDVRRYHRGQWEPLIHSLRSRQAVRTALTAAYALGFDAACVTVGENGGRSMPIDLSPLPPKTLWPLFCDAVAEEILEALGVGVSEEDVQFGADIELVITKRDNQLVAASDFLPFEGEIGCDRQTAAGQPHRHPLGELRPAPERSAVALMRNVWQLVNRLSETLGEGYLLYGGSQPAHALFAGGHLHLSGVRPTFSLLHRLDLYLALPLLFLEDPADGIARRRKYGRLGEFRIAAHDGFEYRTLPSFLTLPSVALGVFVLFEWLVRHYRQLPPGGLVTSWQQQAFYTADTTVLLPVLCEIRQVLFNVWEDRSTWPLIEPLFSSVRGETPLLGGPLTGWVSPLPAKV
ncbi:MAG: hypothetical protein IMW91_07715 [Firmicutes bacterium]|nr:hypothetical protein [Bacillota bacterium]